MDFNMLAGLMGPIQQALTKAGEERAKARFEGRAGGGAVVIRLTGALQVDAITIQPAAAGDAAMLEDLLRVALNDALTKIRNEYGATPQDQMGKLVSGANLGGMFGGKR